MVHIGEERPGRLACGSILGSRDPGLRRKHLQAASIAERFAGNDDHVDPADPGRLDLICPPPGAELAPSRLRQLRELLPFPGGQRSISCPRRTSPRAHLPLVLPTRCPLLR